MKLKYIYFGIMTLNLNNNKNESESNKKQNETKINQKAEDNPYLKFKQKASDSTKASINTAINTSKNINDNIRLNLERAKKSPSYKEIQDKLSQVEKTVKTKQNDFRKNSPRILVKIKNGFLSGFEQIVGRIRIGTQYGKSSIDLLSDLAKLKELGILTEEEFNSKKKELLDRI